MPSCSCYSYLIYASNVYYSACHLEISYSPSEGYPLVCLTNNSVMHSRLINLTRALIRQVEEGTQFRPSIPSHELFEESFKKIA